MAMRQPSPGAPSTWSSGTKTPSKNSSANPCSPSSWAIGRTVTSLSGNMKYVRPRWRADPGSDLNRPKPQSAYPARELQVFCPYSRQPPSTRSARERSEARSLPASGSDQAWAQTSSARAILPRNLSRWAAVPVVNRVGASRKMPFWPTLPGAPAAQYSSSKISHSTRDASRPPYSRGQLTTE